ncbi:copper amine oxidase N-terminal domain-containing protein [Saccharibacillus alkalitolerans]|uniref:Copper amine oxidase N-terminal domain-containing protein n=1 Tax=Saccharibacillus alkalitolerans TaxID=2705290 RepID=A0ABX0F8M6_9BACL|nr:copper amine oxidase N-terminal domain-containing protein [Saccharibacillus alkalitolerans]NGZ77311.1 copper amine oxidase N-terminal domain-containing protein [Saccharibacillus alkalitolerans]
MNKKISAAVLAGALLMSAGAAQSANAAPNIKIFIDGVELKSTQPPIAQGSRTLAPLRSIFQGLNAKVQWNQKTQTITAYKGSNTIVLKIGSKVATVNGQKVTLDVPAKAIRGNTVVPLRFISESLGQDVRWNAASQSVIITTTPELAAPTSVSVRSLGQYGDGRDLQVSFTKSADESYVDHYRLFVVKSGTPLTAQTAKTSLNYTTVLPNGSNQNVTLNTNIKDSSGDSLKPGQAYQVYVAAIGNNYAGGGVEVSSASSAVTLSAGTQGAIPTAVKATDTGDYRDGRDLTVSFAKAQNESDISGYRVFVVRTANAGSFNLSAANAVPAQNYTTVPKGSAAPSVTLTSQSRDTAGNPIQNGVPYTVFVMGVSSSNTAANNTLSAASASVTLATSGSDVSASNVAASDVSDYGDGRDLRVTFNRADNEANVNQYRVMVVKDSKASNFNINSANAVTSANYTAINKTGGNISQTLSSSARDTDGDPIRNGIAYRVYVLTVGAGTSTSTNVLSNVSQPITLGGNNVGTALTPVLSDGGNYGDGRDLLVTFGRASDESSVSEYRVLVVKSASASNFNLASAVSVPAANYTVLPRTGANQSTFLNASTRDVNGEPIRNGVAYRVFVLSVGTGNSNNNANFALSGVSNAVTLSNGSAVAGATNVAATANNLTGNASDVEVTFTRSSEEADVSEYRILAVPSNQSGSYSLANANAAPYYTTVSASGSGQVRQALNANSRDVNGSLISNNGAYRFYVLTVSKNGANVLSDRSNEISLSEAGVPAATNVRTSASGQSVTVSFAPPANAAGTAYYNVMLVPSNAAANFTVGQASAVTGSNAKYSTGGNVSFTVNSDRDAFGNVLQAGVQYRAFVLSVANGSQATGNALSENTANDFSLTN